MTLAYSQRQQLTAVTRHKELPTVLQALNNVTHVYVSRIYTVSL